MITNPPHTRMTEFIVRGLTLIDTGRLAGFVLLSRQGHDVTLGRAAAFNRAAYEWRSCWRPWWKPRKKVTYPPGSLPNGRHGCTAIPARPPDGV
jgi:hypothetical protein